MTLILCCRRRGHGLRDAGRRAGGERCTKRSACGWLGVGSEFSTIDRRCGSSQQAAHFAAQGVIAGAYDVVVAAGVSDVSCADGASMIDGKYGFPFGPKVGVTQIRVALFRKAFLLIDCRPVGPQS